MRKSLALLLCASLLMLQTTSTIIITHSTPKFFQLSKNKMAIVIDQDENQAMQTLSHANQQTSLQAGTYSSSQLHHQTTTHAVESTYSSAHDHDGIAGILGVPTEHLQENGQIEHHQDIPQEDVPASVESQKESTPQPVPLESSQTEAVTEHELPKESSSEEKQEPTPLVQQHKNIQEETQFDLPQPSNSYDGGKVGSSNPVDIGLPNPTVQYPLLYQTHQKDSIQEAQQEIPENKQQELTPEITIDHPMIVSTKPEQENTQEVTTEHPMIVSTKPEQKNTQEVITEHPMIVSAKPEQQTPEITIDHPMIVSAKPEQQTPEITIDHPMIVSTKPQLSTQVTSSTQENILTSQEPQEQNNNIDEASPKIASTVETEKKELPKSSELPKENSLTSEPAPKIISSYPTIGLVRPAQQVSSTSENVQPVLTSVPSVTNRAPESKPNERSIEYPTLTMIPQQASSKQVITSRRTSSTQGSTKSSGPTLASLMSFSSQGGDISDLSVEQPHLGGDSGVIGGRPI